MGGKMGYLMSGAKTAKIMALEVKKQKKPNKTTVLRGF
jgi:hypothetical protein